jgi:hypothetical protein
MFQSLFKRAEVAIEQTVGNVIARIVVAVPFLVAGGFGTAALASRLNRDYDPQTANLIMAAIFLAIGVIAAIVVAFRPTAAVASAEAVSAADPIDGPDPTSKPMGDVDRELLMAALTTAAPMALPLVSRMLVRNLPIIAAVGAALFVMTRSSPEEQRVMPAE